MDKTPLEMAIDYAKGNIEIQTAWEDGFVAGRNYQLQIEVEETIRLNNKANEVWERATGKRRV